MHRVLLAVGLALIGTAPAFAWGALGHRLVGELAERRLSPGAREQVRALLSDEVEPTLAGVANWPDQIRDLPAFEWTAPLHYVHIRDRACRFDIRRDCRDGECVAAAIPRYARKLGDTSLTRAERAEALKFLVHFVGDVHQPLHSGHRPDKGGNDFQISLRWRTPLPNGTNLHGVWDYFLLASAGDSEVQYAARLQATLPPPRRARLNLSSDAARWSEDSCQLTNREGFYPRRPGKLPADYLERMRPLAEARLQLAAARLAQLIELALARRP